MIYEKGRYKETCGPCGAVFEVVVFGGPMAKASDEAREDYSCPGCGHVYHCRGTTSPRVTLISHRTDNA
jgi:DNA-directed RNA polymerase subunit RPC12/RpoP